MSQQGQPEAPGLVQGQTPNLSSYPMYKPEQMRNITLLSQEERQKYEIGLRQLWHTFDNNPDDSVDKAQARKKILEFAPVLQKKVRERQEAQRRAAAAAAAAAAAQQQGGGGDPQQQGGGQAGNGGALPSPGGAQASQSGATPQSGPGNNPPGPQQTNQPPKLTDQIQAHLNKMTWNPPQQIVNQGDQAVQKWRNDARKRYTQSLMQMETVRGHLVKLDKLRVDKSATLTPEEEKQFADKKAQLTRVHDEANRFVEAFRKQQETVNAQAGNAAAVRPQPGAQQQSAQQGQQGGQNKGQPQNTSLQSSQANINGAFEAAKKEQLAAAARMPGANGIQQAQPSNPNEVASPVVSSQPQTQQPPTHIKIEPGLQQQQQQQPLVPVNAQIPGAAAKINMPSAANAPNQIQRVQTPQSAGGINPQAAGNIRHFSHQKAIEEANRQRSISGASLQAGTPASGGGVMGASAIVQQGHPQAHPANQTATIQPKMPVPKVLSERSMQTPQPVATAGGVVPGRPTYTMGGGIAGGVMNQPVVSRIPAVHMEGEGERVLNKKKLDELVRQVCGGTAEDQDGNMLTPQVEESVLTLADSFVDTVLQSACRNAKERGSKVLEIRDIQLILERVYNIRIPGYSSDELRTVRKVQPSAAWISKMSAVQAAKVTQGNKADL